MKLRVGLFLNYTSQLYSTLLAVLLVPVLEFKMGAEAYGLVAFFSMLFAAFYVLDLGLTPMVQREYARMRGREISALGFMRLWRAFFLIFSGLSIFGALLVAFSADALVYRWLNLSKLSHETARWVVVLMGWAVALRWWSGLHRGVVSGGERMAWLPAFNAAMATLRFPGALACMYLWGFDVATFFVYQLGVALLEWCWLASKARTLLPRVGVRIGWSLAPLKPLWRTGVAGALAAASGALLTQVDKALLSGMLPLGEFGHFSMVVLVATTVTILGAPIGAVLMPRLVLLHAQGKESDLVKIYRMGTRLTSALALGGGLTLAFCAKPLLTAWTGDPSWAENYWPVLSLYALGYGCWIMGWVVYFLQYARGQLHWHAWGCVIIFLIWSVTVWVAASVGGVVAVAAGWLAVSGAYLLFWTWVIHAKFLPGLHGAWILRDVLSMNWPIFLGVLLVSAFGWNPNSRQEAFIYVVLVGGFLMAMNMAWWAWVEREHWVGWLRRVEN